jgi:hypothetical protein
VAATKDDFDRARSFFEIALIGAPTEEVLGALEQAARETDEAAKSDRLRRTLATAMSAGGQGARDGGRSRGALLRRAATLAHRDLGDLDQAFAWLGDALIAHVEAPSLDALDELAHEVDNPRRAEETISRALAEVFDGPLVRQLLTRRSKIRREQLKDRAGAASDLRKLHDLSPSDQALMDELSSLLMDLGDYRSMVQVYEDQLLRGKDMTARSELARKVARMWEEQLEDPREAADAWRRVLRMKAGDAEATAGLERAKSTMLKKLDSDAPDAYAPPKLGPPVTVMPPPGSPSGSPPSGSPPSGSPSGSPSASSSELPPEPPKEESRAVPAETEEDDSPASGEEEDDDTPIYGVDEDLEIATENEPEDSEAPPAAAEPKVAFADVDIAFAEITTAPEPTGAKSAPSLPDEENSEDENSAVDLSDLSPETTATSGGGGDILVIDDIDDIAQELEEAEDASPPKESASSPANPAGPGRGSSLPPPIPRH